MIPKILILISSAVVFFTSCNQTTKQAEYVDTFKQKSQANTLETDKGYILMKNYCYACHNPNAVSHDSILAPPFRAVKIRYSRVYDNKKDFVNAIVSWAQNPDENKALMYGAVQRFKVMPKLPLETSDLEAIANYIYENDVEQPEWMEEHMTEMQGKGMHGKNAGKKF
jgi:hypothetical protein